MERCRYRHPVNNPWDYLTSDRLDSSWKYTGRLILTVLYVEKKSHGIKESERRIHWDCRKPRAGFLFSKVINEQMWVKVEASTGWHFLTSFYPPIFFSYYIVFMTTQTCGRLCVLCQIELLTWSKTSKKFIW